MINNKIRMFRMVNGGLELFGATMLCFWMFVLLGAPPTFVTGIVSVVQMKNAGSKRMAPAPTARAVTSVPMTRIGGTGRDNERT